MACLTRVDKKRRTTGTGQSGRYFTSDMARFTHANNNYTPTAVEQMVASLGKLLVDAGFKQMYSSQLVPNDRQTQLL
jgi:hypothetical protein